MLYLIINETARTGKAAEIWKELQKDVMKLEIPYTIYKTKYQGHAVKLAGEICNKEDSDKCIVVLGGDGTMNEVLNGIKNFDDVRFGIVPLGSGNDFGRGHEITTDWNANLKNIVNNIKKGNTCYTPVDIGLVKWGKDKQRYFGISAGIGMDAIVTHKVNGSLLKKVLNKLHIGKLSYSLMTVYTLFSMKTFNMNINGILQSGEVCREHYEKTIFAAAMNLKAEGGGVPMAPHATGDNGLISLSSAAGIPKWKTFFCLPVLLAAKHEKINGFSVNEFASVSIDVSIPVSLHADGEYLGDVKKAELICMAGKLRLLN